MGVYIKGMEMPTEEEISKCIIVRHDGEVWIVDFDNLVDGGFVACWPTNPMRAVPVPPHGRLIDADALRERATIRLNASNHGSLAEAYWSASIDLIDDAPTIIPAEEVKKT